MPAHKDPIYTAEKTVEEIKKLREAVEALVIILSERLPEPKSLTPKGK
jgi:hypothetical protein